MRPLKQLTCRVKVLHRHKKTDCKACIDAASLRHADGGPYNPLPLPANWFGWHFYVAECKCVGRGCRGWFGKGPLSITCAKHRTTCDAYETLLITCRLFCLHGLTQKNHTSHVPPGAMLNTLSSRRRSC